MGNQVPFPNQQVFDLFALHGPIPKSDRELYDAR
jgi:hypothetical protein